MNSPAEDIKDMLAAESALALTFGTDLFIGREPSSPDNCVTIFDTGGRPPQLTFDNEFYGYPSIQIRIRNNHYQVGWALVEQIKLLLHGKGQETWNDTLYSVIYCSSGPAHLDWDENNRARFIINFNIQRR